MAERLFHNHCDRLSIEFETNDEKQERWTDKGYKVFTEYRLKTKINPVPKNSNIPSHILVFTEQASAQTTFFVIFEKQFPKKRVTLDLCSEESQEDFEHLLNVKLTKYTPRTDEIQFTTDGLRRTLQEHCNAGGVPIHLGDTGYFSKRLGGSIAQFYCCQVYGFINPIDGKTPQNVSYCGVDERNTAELRFNIEDRGNEPIKIIEIASIEKFKEALNTYLPFIPRVRNIIPYLGHIFETWCIEIKVSFENSSEVIMEGKNTFKQYTLHSQIKPVPITGNIPSHILIGVDGEDTRTIFVRFEKQFQSKRIVLKEFQANSMHEFKTIIVSNIQSSRDRQELVPDKLTNDNLHAALQQYCNNNNIPVDLATVVDDYTDIDGHVVPFKSYKIVDMVRNIKKVQPQTVSFYNFGYDRNYFGKLRAQVRFNVLDEISGKIIPKNIVDFKNIYEFTTALRENLVLPPPTIKEMLAINAQIDRINALLEKY